MIRGLYTAVSGLVSLEAKQDSITNNLANANTNGFKSDDVKLKSFKQVLIENRDKTSGGMSVRNPLGYLSLGSAIDGTYTKWTQGSVEDTNKDTDFAIEGAGFFVVRTNTPEGMKEYYTRDGSFKVNAQGYLTTNSGDAVIGTSASGAQGPIFVGNGKLAVDGSGNILVDGKPSGKLLTADFQDYGTLKKVGDNLYEGQNPNYQANTSIRQGSLEKSNVNIMSEMVDMISVMRSFESNQKVIQTIDETLGKAANEVGAVR